MGNPFDNVDRAFRWELPNLTESSVYLPHWNRYFQVRLLKSAHHSNGFTVFTLLFIDMFDTIGTLVGRIQQSRNVG